MIALPGPWDEGLALGSYNNPEGGRSLLGEAIYRYQYREQWYLVDSLARWAQSTIQVHSHLKVSISLCLSLQVVAYRAMIQQAFSLIGLANSQRFLEQSGFWFAMVSFQNIAIVQRLIRPAEVFP